MKLLMHICCANCGLYPLKSLFSKGIDIKGLWFNPNIHPEDEYSKRLDALNSLEGLWGLDIEYLESDPAEFFHAVEALEGRGVRCEACYRMRLDVVASTAKKMGLDGFTTSLLVSPYQKFDLIASVGREMERKHSISFYFEDFRPGYKEGVGLSKELGLYRQRYCGCVFSKAEREGGSRHKKIPHPPRPPVPLFS